MFHAQSGWMQICYSDCFLHKSPGTKKTKNNPEGELLVLCCVFELLLYTVFLYVWSKQKNIFCFLLPEQPKSQQIHCAVCIWQTWEVNQTLKYQKTHVFFVFLAVLEAENQKMFVFVFC